MVFVNDKKFACEACIKGHRSSACVHSDRPLYEIKKKGRPVSQCEKCRELRSTKKVHSKCTCSDGRQSRSRENEKSFGSKQKRYIPLVPTLPNGLQDAFPPRTSCGDETPADPRQRVETLLNPCPCADVWTCTCEKRPSSPIPGSSSGLAALVRAAELFSNQHSSGTMEPVSGPSRNKHYRSRRTSPQPPPKRAKRPSPTPGPGPDLPPLHFANAPSTALPPTSRTTDTMPSFSKLSTLAGSGCSCGLECACPGCVVHSDQRCGDDCGSCVDPTLRELGTGGDAATNSVASSKVLERFFAHAARVPLPPSRSGIPVDLPKLCCGGSCGCGGKCGCGPACNGCCVDDDNGQPDLAAPPVVSSSCCSS